MGLKEALGWVKDQVWQQVVIETDSLITVQAVRNELKLNSVFGLLVLDCQCLLYSSKIVSLVLIRLPANRVAHYVARDSRVLPDRCFDEHSAPAELKALMYSDCLIY